MLTAYGGTCSYLSRYLNQETLKGPYQSSGQAATYYYQS